MFPFSFRIAEKLKNLWSAPLFFHLTLNVGTATASVFLIDVVCNVLDEVKIIAKIIFVFIDILG